MGIRMTFQIFFSAFCESVDGLKTSIGSLTTSIETFRASTDTAMASIKSLVLYGFLFTAPVQSAPKTSLDSFVRTERAKAVQGILDNIGPDGKFDQGAAAGLVVASPSKVLTLPSLTLPKENGNTYFFPGEPGLCIHMDP